VGGEADALIQDKVQDAMMDEPNLSSVVLAARLGISAGGVRSCVCRLRKRGVLPPPARQYAPSSRPRAGAQKEAIRAAVLADPDISSAALAARLGTSPDTVRSCISLLRRSGALPPAPRRRAEPAPPAEPQPREPQLQERIQAAVLAEPRVTSTTLAARFNTSPASVRSAVGTLRQRGLLPPAPERPLVEPDTMRGRLLQLITEQPGISAVGAAPALGVGIMAIHDASHALRKKGLILPNDPALPGLYPLSSKGAAMPAEKKPADTDARLQEALAAEEAAGTLIADLADALGIETDEGVDGADVLVVVRAQTEIVKRLIEEKQGAMVKADRLEREVKDLKSRVTGLMDELASERRSYSDLERDLRLAEVRLATATPNLIAADLERRIELWGSAYRLEQEAEKLQQQQSETLACGIVLSADELDSVAALRLDRAMVLRSQALTGAA